MAKKRKAPASQPSQSQAGGQLQIPVQEQTTNYAVVKKEEEQEDEHFEENNEVTEHGEEDEEDEEEENDEESTGINIKAVKVEPNGEYLMEEPVEKLLEPFSKEQLVLLMKEAVTRFPDLIGSVEKVADADPGHRKIFVHGLGWDTTTETLISEYSKYGEIEDCKAVVDKSTGKSKGYGFILFKHRTGARKALKEPQKKMGNRITSCQLASAGPIPAPPPTAPAVSEYTQRKIFVSNVAAEMDPQKLTEFFSKFGEIEEGPLGLDKQTGKPKGFALFVYKNIESAKKALEEPHKNFEGHTLHCQKAVDGPKPVKGFNQRPPFHHPAKKPKYSGARGGAGASHLMSTSSVPPVGFTPPPPQPALFEQALTALFAGQGVGLGISNILGGLGAPANPQGLPHVGNSSGFVNQGGAGYQQGGSRPPQGGSSYMGQGH